MRATRIVAAALSLAAVATVSIALAVATQDNARIELGLVGIRVDAAPADTTDPTLPDSASLETSADTASGTSGASGGPATGADSDWAEDEPTGSESPPALETVAPAPASTVPANPANPSKPANPGTGSGRPEAPGPPDSPGNSGGNNPNR